MNQTEQWREQVSALADGQLEGVAFARTVDALCEHDELQASWRAYHLVGDVLRSGVHAPCTDSSAFLSRLQQRLAAEAAPVPARVPQATAVALPVRAEAANEPVFRWKMVAGVASIAAAAAIGWNWIGSPSGAPAGAQVAQQSAPAPAAGQALAPVTQSRVLVGNGPQVMLRDPRLDELLQAHQEAGGVSQMGAGFLRNATFEGASR